MKVASDLCTKKQSKVNICLCLPKHSLTIWIEYYKVKSKTISSMIIICCLCDQQWENIPESFEFNNFVYKKIKNSENVYESE